MIPPAFWYLFVVLGIPLLHHGKNGYEQFAEYAALITVICAAVLGVNLLFSVQYISHLPGCHDKRPNRKTKLFL